MRGDIKLWRLWLLLLIQASSGACSDSPSGLEETPIRLSLSHNNLSYWLSSASVVRGHSGYPEWR